jgi:aryl-alcohol dehydrogenase-like predicted oxidoreductase
LLLLANESEGGQQSRVWDLETAGAILDIFQKYGHNEIDTARAYGEGTSETVSKLMGKTLPMSETFADPIAHRF